MEIIELRHPYNKDVIPSEPVVLVLGFFDGVHLGHQKVIETGKAAAKEKETKNPRVFIPESSANE